ncbi:TonB-linked outer membrane protein, SusC/RagA family [Mucilaginibacter mallensis]|uniref:TonB-linked outer membrane protein, SusC/RagA family n=1 Tax=Mucilaginibacter mallensis TaxID=652787 RepID=A0A1H1SF49_MUCMA|nr:SusC/RagA family TonB-linked outer membrane protein [Mucilaginibacter mallensis]SDS46710.1 TonB-linked outer membrane protein, SusC/RagA family [Mucilaginibacter mallensis]
MKIYLQNHFDWCKIMKITFSQIVIILIFTGMSYATTSKGQAVLQQRFDVNIHSTSLGTALKQLEKEASLKFVYPKSLVAGEEDVAIDAKQQTLGEILTAILQPRGIAFAYIGDRIVLSKINQPVNETEQKTPQTDATVPADNNTKTVTGKVTDEENMPLPGVTVKIKGTSLGTQTNIKGEYSLSTPDAGATLIFSFIGFVQQEVLINGQSTINIQLKGTPSNLNEVVVIGYGSQRKSDVTSAVATVQAKDFVSGPVTDAAALLKGKVAGLSVSNPSGDPNAQSQIILRGINTIGGANTAPLVIVDGVPGDLLTVAPEDIAEISVLKDASATAIYGVNGSNGVIIITTKHSNGGITEISYNGSISTQQISRAPKLLTAQDYRNQIAAGTRDSSYDKGSSTDWMKAIENKFPLSELQNLTFRGGNNQTNYLASLDYRFLNGIFQQSNHQQITGRVDINHSMLDGKLKFNLGLLQTNFNDLPFNYYDYEQVFKMNPTAPVKEPNGSYYQEPNNFEYQNPVSDIYNTDQPQSSYRDKYNATITILPVDGLRLVATGSYQKSGYLNQYFANFQNISTIRDAQNGVASTASGQSIDRYLNLSAEYSKAVGDHHFALLAGYEYQDDDTFNSSITNHDFPTDDSSLGYNDIGLGAAQKNGLDVIGSSRYQTNLISYFGRFTYNYKDKYLLLASLRIDGASQLYGAKEPYGKFPSVQAGWRITKEDFMADQHIFDDLKLRIGYGVTGNQPAAGFLGVGLLGYGNYILYNGQWIQTLGPSQNANPDLRWEQKHETNLGLDYVMFKGLINGTIDVYDNKTTGLLYNYQVPSPPNLYPNTEANVGTLENKGIEVAINVNPIRQKDFQWTSGFTFSTNSNKLISLSNDLYKATVPYFVTGNTGDPITTSTNIVQVGQPIGQFFGFKVVGVSADGKWIYQEPNGKDVPYDQFNHAFSDKQVLGNGLPKYYAGWNNTINYKNWDFSVTMRGAFHFQILNSLRMNYENTSVQNYNRLASSQDKVFGTAVLNSNIPEEFNSYYIENGDFWKIDNINVGYTFKQVKSKYIRNIRVYVSTLNTFTITGYKGTDPEVPLTGGSALSPGVESRDAYPSVRTFTLGFSAHF